MSTVYGRKKIIDLNQSSQTSALPVDLLLHSSHYDELFNYIQNISNKIDAFTKNLNSNEKQICYDRMHDVITVHGTRGIGKTTFLLSALSLINNDEKFKEYTVKKGRENNPLEDNNYCVLDIMDPTLFACREHLLHAVLSQVNKKVCKKIEGMNTYICSDTSNSYEDWFNKLQKLAKGLKAVGEVREDFENSVTQNSRWEDAEFLLENDLDNMKQSMGLEKAFHEIINTALKILEKRAFILALDDTDTRPAIGWHVLEIIRRYFTTPQLIVIISGDMDLFATIIRQQHIKSLGLNVTSELVQNGQYKARVDGLTEQYLLKILKSNTRIRLGSFRTEYLENKMSINDYSNIIICKTIKNELIERSLSKLLDIFFECIGCKTIKEKNLFANTLFINPARTVLQALEALFEFEINKEKSKNEKSINLAYRFCEIFFIQLQEFGFYPFGIYKELITEHGISHLMNELLPNKHIALGLELLPHYAETSENEALLALQVNFAQAVYTKPSIFFSYLLKACLLREILNKDEDEIKKEHYERISTYLCLDKEEPLSLTTKRISLLLWKDINSNSPLLAEGCIRLYQGRNLKENAIHQLIKQELSQYKKFKLYIDNKKSINISDSAELSAFSRYISKNKFYKEFTPYFNFLLESNFSLSEVNLSNTISTLNKKITSWNGQFVNLGVVEINSKGNSYSIFSIFSLLSLMSEVMSCDNKKEFEELLHKLTSIDVLANYSAKAQKESIYGHYFSDEDDEEEALSKSLQTCVHKDFWLETLTNWWKKSKNIAPNLPCTLAARIQSRFFTALQKISNLDYNKVFLGQYIHRCLIAFFNSVLVEEFLLSQNRGKSEYSVSFDNPVRSSQIFSNNLFSTKAETETSIYRTITSEGKHIAHSNINFKNYPLFDLIFSFPLWGMYLCSNKESVVEVEICTKYLQQFPKDFTNSLSVFVQVPQYKKGYNFLNLYPLLNTVAIPTNFTNRERIVRIKSSE